MSRLSAGPDSKSAFHRTLHLWPVLTGLFALAACQSAPVRTTGYLSNYDHVSVAKISPLGTSSTEKVDGQAEMIERVYIAPAVLRLENESRFTKDDLARVQSEVDRQICFEVSEHFIIEPAPSAQAGTVRTAIVTLKPTGRTGSAVSAVANFALPLPGLDIRTPMTTGSIGIETELLGPDGKQLTSLLWSREAELVGRIAPSMSRVGDALQLVEPMGDAVGKAYGYHGHVAPIADPDPCARFGPRHRITGTVAGAVISAGTGLYVPEVEGGGAKVDTPVKE